MQRVAQLAPGSPFEVIGDRCKELQGKNYFVVPKKGKRGNESSDSEGKKRVK